MLAVQLACCMIYGELLYYCDAQCLCLWNGRDKSILLTSFWLWELIHTNWYVSKCSTMWHNNSSNISLAALWNCISKNYWLFIYTRDTSRGTWVARSVKHLTLGFGSGHDLRVMGSSSMLGFVLSGESAWQFSPPVPPPTRTSPLSVK